MIVKVEPKLHATYIGCPVVKTKVWQSQTSNILRFLKVDFTYSGTFAFPYKGQTFSFKRLLYFLVIVMPR